VTVTDPGQATAGVVLPNLTAWDNVGLVSAGFQPSQYVAGARYTFPVGTTRVAFAAADTSLNLANVELTIIVTDNQPPNFTGCPTTDPAAPFVFRVNTTARQPTAVGRR
jgi:hypothetical protein